MGDAGRVSNFYMVAVNSAIVLVLVLVLDGMAVGSAQQRSSAERRFGVSSTTQNPPDVESKTWTSAKIICPEGTERR
jgi:hypothetical protein